MFHPSLMRDLNDDFFVGPMENMRRMESMVDSMMSPFGNMFGTMGMHPAIQDGRHLARGGHNQNSLMPFGFGHSLFPNMDNMFGGFANMSQDPNCHSFSSSSVMTYSTDGTGQPQMYQATSSTRTAPGGVKETRETLQDSRTGVQKMAIGHHLNDQAHVVEKKKYRYSGEEEENHEFVNLEEDDVDNFNNEWQMRAHTFQRNGHAAIGHGGRQWRERSAEPDVLAITDGSHDTTATAARQPEVPVNASSSFAGKKRTGYLKRKGKVGSPNHKHGRPHPKHQE